MANNLQDSLLKAVDVIVNKRIEDIALDKTIVASIEKCVDAAKGVYRVQYQGGSITVYARDGASYTPKTSVYVSIPQNDFSQKKWIIGKASQMTEDDNITAVSSTLANYQTVGKNVVSVKDNNGLKRGLISYTVPPETIMVGNETYENPFKDIYDDYIVLYDYGNRGNNIIDIDQNAFRDYMKESIALMIEANFRTSLTEEQQLQNNAEYGLGFTLVFEQGDATYNTMQEKYNVLAHTIGIIKMWADGSTYKVTLKTYNEDGLKTTIQNEQGDEEEKTIIRSFKSFIPEGDTEFKDFFKRRIEQTEDDGTITIIGEDPFSDFVDELAAYRYQVQLKYSEDEADFVNQYYNLMIDLLNKRNANEEVNPREEYESWLAANVNTRKEKISYYVLDSADMVGTPFNFPTPTEQYTILPVNTGKFVRVENVFFYCKGFIQDAGKALYVKNYKGGDIFVSDIEFYALKELDAISGDYRLTYTTANGTIFYETEMGENGELVKNPTVIPIRAKLTYKVNQDLSANAVYYWFKKDGRVNISHENYSQYGGAGWCYMKDKGNGREIAISRDETTAYENVYKCVCVYNELTRLVAQITIYNNDNKRDIKITSDRGTEFVFDAGIPLLTCSVNDRTDFENMTDEDVDQNITSYRFVWNRIDQDGTIVNIDKSGEEAQEEYDKVREDYIEQINNINSDTSLTEKEKEERKQAYADNYKAMMYLKTSAEELSGVSFKAPNQLLYPIYKVKTDTFASFECHVYAIKIIDNNPVEVYYGSAIITLQNTTGSFVGSHYIVIENGDQVFQYTETGVSPASDRFLDPQKPANLICHLYSPSGIEIPNSDYNVVWTYPLSNTLIIAPNQEEMKENPVSGLYEWYTAGHTAPVTIAENYNYSCVRNQIKCEAHYANLVVSKDTEFYFGKVGDNGSNGTDVIAKIDPADLTTSILDTEALALVTVGGDRTNAKWSCPELFSTINSPALELKLYHRGKYINPKTVNGAETTWHRNYKNIKWDIAGGKLFRKWINASSDTDKPWLGVVDFNRDDDGTPSQVSTSLYTGFLIRAQASLDIQKDQSYGEYSGLNIEDSGQTYTAFYPVCWVNYLSKGSDQKYRVGVDSNFYLKQIQYNADGRTPSYNKNQGVGLIVTDLSTKADITDQCSYSWVAKGGLILTEEDRDKIAYENTPSFSLFYERDGNTLELCTNETRDLVENGNVITYEGIELSETTFPDEVIPSKVYIKPEDIYTGAAQNNYVISTVSINGEDIATVIIPIYMSLNRYGLASLNAWDGNTVEINEEGNYIMAPQIGAGIKTNEQLEDGSVISNGFTGIVMGTFDTYDPEEKNKQIKEYYDKISETQNPYGGNMVSREAEDMYYPRVGLTGFHQGAQSMFLNAKTGSLILGLSTDEAKQPNANLEGQIALVPGGTSKIGSWKIGSKLLYNMNDPNQTLEEQINGVMHSYHPAVYPAQTPYEEYCEDRLALPHKDNYRIDNAVVTIPPQAQGIVLSADPAYISVKSRPFKDGDGSGVNFYIDPEKKTPNANVTLFEGDSLEVEIDPHKSSVFSIYRVTPAYPEKSPEGSGLPDYNQSPLVDANGNTLWRRYPLVGINANGQFYSNAVENSEAAMAIGKIGAFGDTAAKGMYIGGKFSWGSNTSRTDKNLLKFFTEYPNGGSITYISGSDDVENECEKSLYFYGNTIKLYGGSTESYNASKSSPYYINVGSDNVGLYHTNSHSFYVNSGGIIGATSQAFSVTSSSTTLAATGAFSASGSSIGLTARNDSLSLTGGGSASLTSSVINLTGATTITGTATVTAKLTANSDLSVGGNADITGNANIIGDITGARLALGAVDPPSSNGIAAQGGIKTKDSFYWDRSDDNMISFTALNSNSNSSTEAVYKSNSLLAHLENLYNLVDAARRRANSAYSEASSAASSVAAHTHSSGGASMYVTTSGGSMPLYVEINGTRYGVNGITLTSVTGGVS